MNGFPLGNNFLCKDMGIMKVGQHCGLFLLVQFGTAWERPQPQGQENVHLCTNTIHKLPFGGPQGIEAFHISDLNIIVKNFHVQARKNSNFTIDYMHGCYEKDLLANPCHPVHQSGMLWLPQR